MTSSFVSCFVVSQGIVGMNDVFVWGSECSGRWSKEGATCQCGARKGVMVHDTYGPLAKDMLDNTHLFKQKHPKKNFNVQSERKVIFATSEVKTIKTKICSEERKTAEGSDVPRRFFRPLRR